MRWKVYGRRTMYQSDWVNVHLDDVELPDGSRIEHHVLDFPKGSAGAVLVKEGRILLIWRHRFITDSWGWEVPAGWIDVGEDALKAVSREVQEETGYRASHFELMTHYFPLAGISTQNYWTFVGTEVEHLGDSDGNETDGLEWKTFDEVLHLLKGGLVKDGPSLLMLSYYLGVFRLR